MGTYSGVSSEWLFIYCFLVIFEFGNVFFFGNGKSQGFGEKPPGSEKAREPTDKHNSI